MKLFLPLLLLLILTLTACQDDITPAWIAIEKIELETTVTVQGEPTENIVDAWVYIDNKTMGVWEIPFKMPVLEEGDHELIIYAGIKINGRGGTRTDYEFYEKYSEMITLTKDQTIDITPKFIYKNTIEIKAKEDFEDTGTILSPDNENDTTKVKIISKLDFPNIVKYGNNCGQILLSKSDTSAKISTNLRLEIPNVIDGKIYLELDYLTNNSFAVGILDKSDTKTNDIGAFAGLKATSSDDYSWKKIYFDITAHVHRNPNSSYFDYYFVGVLDQDNDNATIYIDNLKIVHF